MEDEKLFVVISYFAVNFENSQIDPVAGGYIDSHIMYVYYEKRCCSCGSRIYILRARPRVLPSPGGCFILWSSSSGIDRGRGLRRMHTTAAAKQQAHARSFFVVNHIIRGSVGQSD